MYSGLKGKGSEEVAIMRRQQIDTLKIFNRVTEVNDGSEYKVEFSSDGCLFNITVSLGADFPLEKPILKVEPLVNHPWVNSSTGEIVSAPGLLKFSIHSELGRVVQAIIREFELWPRPLSDGTSKDYKPNDNCSNDVVSNAFSIGSSNGDSTITSTLNSLTISQLERMNNDTDCLDEFVNGLPIVTNLTKALEDQITLIESLANDNLNRESDLSTLKTEVNSLTGELSETYKQYQTLTSDYSKLCEKFNPQSIRESLVSSILKIDEESEKIAEKFLDGEIDLERFLSDYSSHRHVSHSRKFKAENLGQQLSKLQKINQAGF